WLPTRLRVHGDCRERKSSLIPVRTNTVRKLLRKLMRKGKTVKRTLTTTPENLPNCGTCWGFHTTTLSVPPTKRTKKQLRNCGAAVRQKAISIKRNTKACIVWATRCS